MNKYNTVLADNYDSNTVNFGTIESDEQIKKGEVLMINNESYIVEDIVNDEDLKLELVVLKPVKINKSVKSLDGLVLEKQN